MAVEGRIRGALGGAVVIVAVLLVGWLLSTVDSGRGFARWDWTLAEWGSTHATDRSTDFWTFVARLGSAVVLVPVMSMVALVDWRRLHEGRAVVFLAVVGFGESVVNSLLKRLVDRDRPPVVHLVDAAGQAFPSGHSAAAASCWLAIALVARRWSPHEAWRSGLMVVGAVAVAGMVALSRTLLGVHWLTDVLAGLVVGWSWCLVWALVLGIVPATSSSALTGGERVTYHS